MIHLSLTRRSFLTSLALALPALQMRASARADEASPSRINTAIERHAEAKRVLILGAGLSGLVAGYELMRAGHDVTILEGRMRPGGRVYTLRTPFSNGLIAEAGASRIPIDHDWTLAYIRQFGLATEPFLPASGAPLVIYDGKRINLSAGTPLSQYFDLSPQDGNLSPAQMAQTYLVPAIKEVLAAGDINAANWPGAALRKFDQYSFFDLFHQQGASPGVAQILFSGAAPVKEISALWGLRTLAATDFDHTVKIIGGNDLLPKAIAARLSHRILYGARVVRMADDPSGVHATFVQGGTQHSLDADYLICTLPFSVLRELKTLPRFGPLKQQAIRAMSYASVTKVTLQTPTRFWEQEGLSGFANTDTNAEIWSPSWDQPSKRGLLQLYQEGPTAREFDRLSPEARLQQGAALVRKIFPDCKPDFGRSSSYSWQLDEFARGAYGLVAPGQYYSWYPGAGSVEGRIHFAGEHLSATPGFMQGAITSGHRAAVEVNDRCRACRS